MGIVLTFAAFRWPGWFVPTDFNPDEAQILAGAITLKRFPVYWKYVDGTTHGPLCELPLVLAGWMGAPLNYITARMMAALLQVLSLIAAWRTLRCFASEQVARLSVLPALAFWAFSSSQEFIHYASELTGLTLLSLATWGLARALTAPADGRWPAWWMAASGVALGAVPFSKLQSAPQAAALTVIALVILWRLRTVPAKTRWGLGRYLIAGGLVVPVVIFIFLLTYGLIAQFKFSYLLSGVDYSRSGNRLAEMPGRFLTLSTTDYFFAWFFTGTLAFTFLYARQALRAIATLRVAQVAGWVQLGMATVCVIFPGRESPHYLHLLVIPATLLAGAVLTGTVERPKNAGDAGRLAWPVFVAFFALTLIPQIYQRTITSPEHVGEFERNRSTHSAAATFILREAKPTDTLAMWGWEPDLYVETGLAQATREAHSAFEIASTPLQSFYVSRYLGDMRRRKPQWFVDAVGSGGFMYTDRTLYGHEMHPELQHLVASEYEFVGEFGNERVYRRKK
ncbi:MAG TPA: hypothetical protein VGM64_01100 [Lacunisphaera sp.]